MQKAANTVRAGDTVNVAAGNYAGFDLCDPTTSVSMTINGPAPILLAMYFNTAIDRGSRD